MRIFEHAEALRAHLADVRHSGRRVALVPTMGNLHAGHLALVEAARERDCHVVASIFVNPMQFGPGEDFERYPRTFEQDVASLRAAGCDTLFAPDVLEVYPGGLDSQTVVSVPELSELHCGASRPGHFNGVATVVCKLFNLVAPDHAFFGRKDYQQLLIIRKMVEDLCMPVCITGVPTVREADGLALSSRNGYLDAAQRSAAPALYRALCETAQALEAGTASFTELEQASANALRSAGFKPDYFTICHARTLLPATPYDKDLVILAAAWLGDTRLIDNLCVSLPR